MARRTSRAEDVVDFGARLPWWVGALLALVAYVGLHLLAGIEIPAITPGTTSPNRLLLPLAKGLAAISQWLVPALLLIGALVSAFKQRKRSALHSSVAEYGSSSSLTQMSWQEFEQMVGEYFRRRGFAITETGGGGADGGVDLVLSKGSDRYLVQCKQWRALKVGVEKVRELYGVMAARRVAGGFVVTSGEFTAEAKRFAEGKEVELIDGEMLALAVRAQAALPPVRPAQPGLAATLHQNDPVCPTCGAGMVVRKAKTGRSAGELFWGCSRFPACRGTRAI